MSHTGFGYNNETVECSNGVQHFTTRNKKWTHWAVPVCIDGDVPAPTPTPTDDKPTLKRGSKGSYVTLAQTQLINKGYSLEPYGADGSFGKVTEAAVKAFQKAHGLAQDGIIGAGTWQALCGAEPAITYTVTIKGLTGAQAEALEQQYPNSTKTQERG
jgi:peptidoglycan hydrolase-like protein with peptidoglycan-binding domain